MKYKIALFIIFIITRIIDLVSTYLVTPDLQSETSPLVRLLGFGWIGFILINIFFVIVVYLLLFVICNTKKLEFLEKQNMTSINSIRDYYYTVILKDADTKKNFFKTLISANIHISSFLYFSIISFVATFIIVGIIVSISNILLLFDVFVLGEMSPLVISNLLFLFCTFIFIVNFIVIVRERYKKLRHLSE